MRTQAKFKEYIWLVNTINKAQSISFADIQKKWLETDMSEGIELARSTFNRHKDTIEDILAYISSATGKTDINILLEILKH